MDLDNLIAALRDPAAYPHPVAEVGHVETHISHVLLAGAFAYKLKKPVDLGFVDFSSPERRRFYCDEELRLNRRLAPQLYLDVVAVTEAGAPVRVGGGGQVLEHAVRMRRFPQQALLSHCKLDEAIIDRLTDRVAHFHAGLPPAPPDSRHGTRDAVLAPMLANFAVIRPRLDEPVLLRAVDRLERWTRARGERLAEQLAARREGGFIRECHGDMHRGNIVLLDGEPVIFDCIEFNPDLRWIDTMSELAFLVMDLLEAGETTLARRALNRYMERTGDYAGLGVLRFYQVYRAMVRAKVLAIRLSQADTGSDERAELIGDLRRYLRLARDSSARPCPRLFITHGLSGSGKTRLGDRLRELLPLIQVRSDVERKRLHGMAPQERPDAARAASLYDADTTRRTYERLCELARQVLQSGYSVLVDATFLTRSQRALFLALGRDLKRPCTILALEAPPEVLRRRLSERAEAGADASDADASILERQLAIRESFSAEERPHVVHLDTTRQAQVAARLRQITAEPRPARLGGTYASKH
jgi:aminoglycoside phosphotransferase family enzyme/predicted kinase